MIKTMFGVTDAGILQAWERGLAQPLIERALLLLAAASAECSVEGLAWLPIGQRDAQMLDLRDQLFGSTCACIVACTACRAQLELSFDLREVRVIGQEPVSAVDVEFNGMQLHGRLPNSRDLIAVRGCGTVENARHNLLRRCFEIDGEHAIDFDSPLVSEAIAECMAAADPQANIEIEMQCPACNQLWHAPFDIAAFLWAEVDAWAQQTLRELHALARAYGWREADMLAMSAQRRQLYLNMLAND